MRKKEKKNVERKLSAFAFLVLDQLLISSKMAFWLP